jgi:CheY-like chemotaxis protein
MMIQKPVVLYVEDDPKSRKVMSLLLKGRMGLKDVTILEDSTDFLAQVAALNPQPEVIFLDIHVKPYDGFEMLQMLRSCSEFMQTPIVALTASVMNEEVQRLQTSGFNGCLAKPIDLNTFPDTFDRILNGEAVWRIFD